MNLFIFIITISIVFLDDSFEKIIRYTPKKFEIISNLSSEYLVKEKILDQSINFDGWRIKKDVNFIWVVGKIEDDTIFFKYHGTLKELELFKNAEPIPKEIVYAYLNDGDKDNRIIHVYGFKNIQAIEKHFSKVLKRVNHDSLNFIQLGEKYLMFKDGINNARIYENIHAYKLDKSNKYLRPYSYNTLDHSQNIKKLAKYLNCKIDIHNITYNDLKLIAEISFDITDNKNILNLYECYCSLVSKYLIDTFGGEISITENGIFYSNCKIKYNISLIVSKTIEYLINYEYNPALYFSLDPEY